MHQAILRTTLDWMFPPQCLACNEPVGEHGGLCQGCWQQMVFLSEPNCARCGFPFEYALGEQALCAGCLRNPPPYTQARAVFRYDAASKVMILKLKYHDGTALAPTLGRWLSRAGQGMLDQCNLIVPVPLHTRRLIKRRFNQAALLASALSKESGVPAALDALQRIHDTPPQTGLSHGQRLKNVRRAFAAHPARNETLRKKNILLVDDVMTTAATLSACTHALHDAGAREVYVLTLARTVYG